MLAGVTVAIPTYNGAAHIRECLRSVLDQPLEQLEVVVCDGGSTDDTVQIIRSFNDPRIRIETSERRLPIEENWTKACSLGRMRYLKLLCQDDLVAPASLAAQMQALQEQPHAVAVAGPREIIDSDGNIVLRRRGGTGLRRIQTGREALRTAAVSGGNAIGEPSAVMFRADALERCLPWATPFPYLLDLEMYARVFQLGDVIVLPDVVASFRVHSGSWSVALGQQQSLDFNAWVDWLLSANLIDARSGDHLRSRLRARFNQTARSIIYRMRVAP
jgi:glycosyltransferase involved in cell wall biosynthesis